MDTNREQAIAVAKDILGHLQTERLKLCTGDYFRSDDLSQLPSAGLLQPYVDYVERQCRVCGLAAFILSFVRLFGKADCKLIHTLRTDARFNLVEVVLKRILHPMQIALIESCFEESVRLDHGNAIQNADAQSQLTEKFLTELRIDHRKADLTHEDVLTGVCDNIIRNEGQFIPEGAPDWYLTCCTQPSAEA